MKFLSKQWVVFTFLGKVKKKGRVSHRFGGLRGQQGGWSYKIRIRKGCVNVNKNIVPEHFRYLATLQVIKQPTN